MKDHVSNDVKWHDSLLRKEQREGLLHQHGCILWMTGLSGSGKSTISRALEHELVNDGRFAYVLDGDNVRHKLNRDLGFSPADRSENIRRCAEVAQLFADAGAIAITAFISPYKADREHARELAGEHAFIEIYISTDIDACEKRDPKGLYQKARRGEIPDFTGISAPYEAPDNPDLIIDTVNHNLQACVKKIVDYIYERGLLVRVEQND